MIGIGGMPRYVPRFRKKLTLAYRRRRPRRRQKQANAHERVQAETMAFDYGPAEFPVATMRPRDARGGAVAAVAARQRWLVARWQWFKPRSVPCAVAALGLIAMVAAGDYLAHHLDQPAPQQHKLLLVDVANR
jgi:hypothetical protein